MILERQTSIATRQGSLISILKIKGKCGTMQWTVMLEMR